MSGDIKLQFIKAVITTGNELKRLFPSIKPLQDSAVCQEFILHVEQADWPNANRLATSVAAVVRAARLRSAAAGEFAAALEAYRQATNGTLSILQVEAIEAKQAAKAQSDFVADVALERTNEAIEQASAKAFERDERDRRIEAMLEQAVEQSQLSGVPSDDDSDDDDSTSDIDIEAAALDCLTPKQRKIVQCLLEQKHFVSVDTILEYPGAFGEGSTTRAATAAIARIREKWLDNGIPWSIRSQDISTEPRFKLEK